MKQEPLLLKVLLAWTLTHRSTLDMTHYYPALSIFRVAKHFTLAEFEQSVKHFSNPFFRSYTVHELVFESPESFQVNTFQTLLRELYPLYSENFLLCAVRFKSDETLLGIFTVFPLLLMDGFRCFTFHQNLMKSLLNEGTDTFQVDAAIAHHKLNIDMLRELVPPRVSTVSPEHSKLHFPHIIAESRPSKKISPYLDSLMQLYLNSPYKFDVFASLQNAFLTGLPFGNLLLNVDIPDIEVRSCASGLDLRKKYKDAYTVKINNLESMSLAEVQATFSNASMPTQPTRFLLNNYGECTKYSAPGLLKYTWHFPIVVFLIPKGATWTISLGENSYHHTAYSHALVATTLSA